MEYNRKTENCEVCKREFNLDCITPVYVLDTKDTITRKIIYDCKICFECLYKNRNTLIWDWGKTFQINGSNKKNLKYIEDDERKLLKISEQTRIMRTLITSAYIFLLYLCFLLDYMGLAAIFFIPFIISIIVAHRDLEIEVICPYCRETLIYDFIDNSAYCSSCDFTHNLKNSDYNFLIEKMGIPTINKPEKVCYEGL